MILEIHCDRKNICARGGKQFQSQTACGMYYKYERCVKVFNSSVENFVEKGF
jgi:hypothetical protein